MPDLARRLCHRHANAYLRARPLDAQAARNALEPLVNLARLDTRAGNGDRAHRLLDNLYTAVTTRTDTTIDGAHIPASDLTDSEAAHAETRRWLWTVHLATGARALASTGRWHEAENHLRTHNGIGNRMLDGRQTAVLARATADDTDAALALLRTTTPGEPWENAVTACLTALCTSAPADRNLFDHHRSLDTSPGLTVFRTRLGLSILDTPDALDRPSAASLATQLVHDATRSNDGYAARDLLTHPACANILAAAQKKQLTTLVSICALGRGVLPLNYRSPLKTALDTAETALTSHLRDANMPACRRPPTTKSARTTSESDPDIEAHA